MCSACNIALAVGTVITLGIFTKMTMLHAYGESILTFPHVLFHKFGLGRDVAGFIFAGSCIALASSHVIGIINELGGHKKAVSIFMDLLSFNVAEKGGVVTQGFLSILTAILWLFILHFYTTQRRSHEKVLGEQKTNECKFIKENCMKFRKDFE
ncbi:putative integral membrane protein [Babesia bovis T2Bo]|uniref:Membrane protein, putative n=1 Tax=Babesia bovis TaxID=5865 RepID=S6BHC7_BABBO|nr:putative integral membrane protein [Babesia bovis T2Bo]KAG6439980.1 putative integral membrane protein [Babesia bovis T2Bo]BAN65634.1 membrane protein, putative [Babesia bovis]